MDDANVENPELDRLRSRLEREKRARVEAERIAEQSTRELYLRQRGLEMVARVAEAANLAESAEKAIGIAVEAVCDYTGWPIGHAFIADKPTGKLLSSKIWHLESREGLEPFIEATEATDFRSGEGLPGRVLASREPAWITDIEFDPNFPRRAAAAEGSGVRGGFALPAMSGGEVFAVLEFFNPLPTDPEEHVLELLGSVGSQLGRALERERAERRFRDLLESSPDPMVIVDAEGTIQIVNAQTENLFGYDRRELVGGSVDVLVPDRFRPEHHKRRDSFVNSPDFRPMGTGLDLSARRKDGREFPVEISLSPIETADGMLVNAAIRDVTERREGERALAQHARSLEEANEELKEFAYVASHDLSEPLRTISGFVQLLQSRYEGKLDEDADEFIGFVVQGTERMQRLIEDLLVYSRVGRQEVKQAVLPLGDVINRVEQGLGRAIEESGAEIVRPNDLPELFADPSQVDRLFQNLIGNAIKFRREDVAPKVEIGARVRGDECDIVVRDNGIGIEPRHADRIFRVFQRLHSIEEYPGTGIGLSICKKVVERHGGTIAAQPAPEHGTEFRLTLPVPVTEGPGETSGDVNNNEERGDDVA